MPILETSFENAIAVAKQLPYNIYSIQQRNFNDNKCLYYSTLYKSSSIEEHENRIFLVKAAIQNDVYDLYVKNEYGDLVKYDTAAIPDYKTSVMMNTIFRNIKENHNLDALEESDDEEEFENVREDKFVKLDKSVTMECEFHKRNSSYVPVKIVENRNVATRSSMNSMERRLEKTNTHNNVLGHSNKGYNNQNQSNQRYNNYNQSNQRYNSHNQSNQQNVRPKHRYNPHSQNNHYRQSFNQ